MNKKISILLIVIILMTGVAGIAEVGIENQVRAYLLADYETGQIIEGYNLEEVVEIASISKLMTYLVVMDEVESGNISLEDSFVIDEEDLSIGGSTLNVELGDMYTIDEALDIALVISANNTTHALAKKVAGTEDKFVKMMNDKADEIGLESSRFYNSTGLPIDGFDDQNKMKVTDILLLSRHIIKKHPEVLERTSLPVVRGQVTIDGEVKEFIPNTNPLINRVEDVDGLKTGFTNKAGYCLVSTFEKPAFSEDEQKFRLISIVMGTNSEKDRGRVSEILVSNARENFVKKDILKKDKVAGVIPLENKNYREVEVFPKEDFKRIIDSNKELDIDITVNELLKTPVSSGDKIGTIKVIQDGETIFETDAISKVTIREANSLIRLFRKFTNFLKGADKVL